MTGFRPSLNGRKGCSHPPVHTSSPWLPGRVEAGLHQEARLHWEAEMHWGAGLHWEAQLHLEAELHWEAKLLVLQQAIMFAELLEGPVSQVCLPKVVDTLSPSPGARAGSPSLPLHASVCQYMACCYILVCCISVENFIPEPCYANSCCTGNSDT